MTIALDHVAIATRDVTPLLDVLVGELGSGVIFGGGNLGFRAMQLDCGALRIELMEPDNVEVNDFLERFLASNGDGPHHLTFKTDDIEREIARAEGAGFRPVGVNIGNPFWREAFLHPRQAGGTVIQIAQSDMDPTDLPDEVREYGPGRWWPDPPPAAAERARLERVVVTTDEMSRAMAMYGDLLGGERADWDEGWVELGWPGGGRVRLEHAAGRREGIDRLEWTHASAPAERTVAGTNLVLYPEGS